VAACSDVQVAIVAPPMPLLQAILPYPALRTLAAHLMRIRRLPLKPRGAVLKVCAAWSDYRR